jgi:cytochrome c556
MIRFARLAIGAATGLAVLFCLALETRANLALEGADAAKVDVNKMVDKLGDANFAQGVAKANGIEDVMHLFKPRNKGGFGIGAMPPPAAAGVKDSIELTIIDLSNDKKGFTKEFVGKYSADLVKAAKQTQAIAEINTHYAPKEKKGAKDPAVWKQLTGEMKTGAGDLAKAAEAKDPAAVKAAATKLNASCVRCHEIFRDE